MATQKPTETLWVTGWLDTTTDSFYSEPTTGMTTDEVLESFAHFLKMNKNDNEVAFWVQADTSEK